MHVEGYHDVIIGYRGNIPEYPGSRDCEVGIHPRKGQQGTGLSHGAILSPQSSQQDESGEPGGLNSRFIAVVIGTRPHLVAVYVIFTVNQDQGLKEALLEEELTSIS